MFQVLAIFLFILAGIVLIRTLIAFFHPKQKQPSTNSNERLFSDTGKSIAGEKGGIPAKLTIIKSRIKSQQHQSKNNDEDFLTDFMLRTFKSRRSYYREVYLKSAAWKRKRFIVLRRDNWSCVHCGSTATQIHHKKYARKIGREPIEWLESICKECHERIHR